MCCTPEYEAALEGMEGNGAGMGDISGNSARRRTGKVEKWKGAWRILRLPGRNELYISGLMWIVCSSCHT